jgi:hypothetical protein
MARTNINRVKVPSKVVSDMPDMNEMSEDSIWSIVQVGQKGLNFELSTDCEKYHNGNVRNCIVYCRPTGTKNSNGETLYFLIYRRPKGYYVGHILTPKMGEGILTTIRDRITGFPKMLPKVQADNMELDRNFELMFGDLKKYNNINHKRK